MEQAGFWLSPQQERVFLATREGASANAIALIDAADYGNEQQVRDALQAAVIANESLRTVFRRMPGVKVPFQVVLPDAAVAWESVAGDADQLFEEARTHVFDLENGPLVHAKWITGDDHGSKLLLLMPAVLSDAASLQLLVGALKGAAAPDEEAVTYVQFSQWQREFASADDEDAQSAKAYWDSAKSHFSAPALPWLKASADVFQLASASFTLDAALGERIAANNEVEPFLLAAWRVFLWRMTAQQEGAIAVFSSGRHYDELKALIGCVGRTIPVSISVAPEARFSQVVQSAASTLEEALRWQDYYVPQPDHAYAGFEYLDHAAAGIQKLEVCGEPFTIKLSALRTASGLTLDVQYDSARLDSQTASLWASYFERMLKAAIADPDQVVTALPLLSDGEVHDITIDWNQTAAEYPNQSCFQQLFEAQAAKTPERVAVQSGTSRFTYQELNEKANQLAHALRRRGVGPDMPVGLCVTRGVSMITAVLGIMKAGGAYVPLIADHPKARLAAQMESAAALVTEAQFVDQLPRLEGKTICLDRDAAELDAQRRGNPELATVPDNLIYVIYTSGSTGMPKGVAVTHRNLVNYATFISRLLSLDSHPDGLQFATVSTLAADLGNTCIYPALMSGGTLHIVPQDVTTDAERFREYFTQHPIDVAKIVPSHLEALLDAGGGREILPRKFLITGGEALTGRVVDKIEALRPECAVINHYGPTETTVGSLTYPWDKAKPKLAASEAVPIGRPIANTRIYVLDAQLAPVAPGVVGELFIGGDGVASGYIGQPELTAERFLIDPFHGGRMYRTGDLVRYLPDRSVMFLGRADDQVKIRGYRVELGEIEAELAHCTGVRRAVVLAQSDDRGERSIAAYVVAHDGKPLDADQLRAQLRNRLPEYMLPVAFVFLPKLPLSPNGKVDRQALPSPEQAAAQQKPYIAPQNRTEEKIAAIWADILGRGAVSVEDNFFELGGHSLLATRIASRLREDLRLRVPVRMIFEQPTVSQLAVAITSLDDDSSEAEITPVARHSGRL